MGWKEPYSPGENPRDKNWRSLGSRFLFGEKDVNNAAIDKAIRQGKDPKRVFGGKIGKMSEGDQRKVNARIRDRKNKAGQ